MYVLVDLIGSKRNSYEASVVMASLTQKAVIISSYAVGSPKMLCYISDGSKEDREALTKAGFVLKEFDPAEKQ